MGRKESKLRNAEEEKKESFLLVLKQSLFVRIFRRCFICRNVTDRKQNNFLIFTALGGAVALGFHSLDCKGL